MRTAPPLVTDASDQHALRIRSVEVIPVEVPRRGSFDLHRGRTPKSSPFTVVRITTEEGVIGYGEGDTQVRNVYRLVRDHLADLLEGESAFDLASLHAKMNGVEMMVSERLSHWNVARCAIDTALYDLIGKYLKLPAYQLLGGKRRDHFEIIKNVTVGDLSETIVAAERVVEDGARCYELYALPSGRTSAFGWTRTKLGIQRLPFARSIAWQTSH